VALHYLAEPDKIAEALLKQFAPRNQKANLYKADLSKFDESVCWSSVSSRTSFGRSQLNAGSRYGSRSCLHC
jgi:hypothetical protein